MFERSLSIYTGPDSFQYTNFPVYKLSRVAFFRYSLLPPKHSKPLLLSSIVPKENPLRHWGIPPLLRHYKECWRGVCLYILVLILSRIQTFPYTNFPVLHFFSSFFTTPKTILNPYCSQALSPKKTL